MGKRSKRKTKPVTGLNTNQVEVVSPENFQKRLEGMSDSCKGCEKERAKKPVVKNKKKGRSREVKYKSPIVIQLSEAMKGEREQQYKKCQLSEEEDDFCSSSESIEKYENWYHSPNIDTRALIRFCSPKDGKNFNAFLSAIEKIHEKDRTFQTWTNLHQQYSSDEDTSSKYATRALLNNWISKSARQENKKRCITEAKNIDVICNDLSSKGIESTDTTSDSENSSVISTTESTPSDSDITSSIEFPPDDELEPEELEQLVQYTTGFALTRYDCPQHECPECLAAWYSAAYAQGTNLFKSEPKPKYKSRRRKRHISESQESVSSHSSYDSQSKDDTESLHSESSTLSLDHDARKNNFLEIDGVFLDLTDTDVSITVYYHSQVNTGYMHSWYSGCSGYWYYPSYYPSWYMPGYYMPPNTVYSIPRSLYLTSEDYEAAPKEHMIPPHELKKCKLDHLFF